MFNLFKKKEREQREREVSDISHAQKNKFASDMVKLQFQASNIHKKRKKQLVQSVELNAAIEDVVSQIAKAVGRGKI